MAALVLGVLALIAVLFLGQLFANSDPKSLAKTLRVTGGSLLALAALALLTLDRVGLGVLLGSLAWGVYSGGHLWPRRGSHSAATGSAGGTGGGRAKAGAKQATRVRTAWIELELDHETGAMRGTVLQGHYKGRALERLSQSAVVALYAEAAPQDGETARLLETYLDRTYGASWRRASQGDRARSGQKGQSGSNGGSHAKRADAAMSRAEAFAVLGLEPEASAEAIRAAHRKLMMQNHPDRGGSDYIAAKINEAKDVLLAR